MRGTCLLLFCLVLAVSACGSEARCPSGSVKNKKNVCVDKSPIDAMDDAGQDRPDADAATEDAADAGAESDACVKSDELCNGRDDDCDGEIDEDLTGDSFVDRDQDGYGTGDAVTGCGGVGYASKTGDCDDDNGARSPGASEVCNGVDDDCNATVDEGVRVPLYLDEDGDGHGLASDSDVFCVGQVVPGRVPSSDDCDDKCPTCSPDNTQETLCDGKDDDCDMQIDDGIDQLFEADCDGDGFALQGAQAVRACTKPTTGPVACTQGTWTVSGGMRDCNDTRGDVSPSAAEVCDGADNDCNALVDEAPGSLEPNTLHLVFSPDVDGDGYVRADELRACAAPNAHWVLRSGSKGPDCADGDPNAYPGSTHSSQAAVSGGTTTTTHDYNCDGANQGPAVGCPRLFVCVTPSSNCWPAEPTCGEASAHTVCRPNLQQQLIVVNASEAPVCR